MIYIAKPIPFPLKLKTSCLSAGLPSVGVKTSSNFPGLSVTISVALY